MRVQWIPGAIFLDFEAKRLGTRLSFLIRFHSAASSLCTRSWYFMYSKSSPPVATLGGDIVSWSCSSSVYCAFLPPHILDSSITESVIFVFQTAHTPHGSLQCPSVSQSQKSDSQASQSVGNCSPVEDHCCHHDVRGNL